MTRLNIENQLNQIGIDLLNFLADNDMSLNRLSGYWKNQYYYQVKYKNEVVCYILFNGAGDEEKFSPLTVWTDDSNTDCYKECHLDKNIQKIAVKKIDICEKCGSCAGGKVKNIFGKEYNNVCKTTFRFVNPNNDELNCLKVLLLLRKNDIEKAR